MKCIFSRILPLCMTVVLVLLSACSPKEIKEPDFPDTQTLHIGGWVAPPPGYINEKTYQEVADSGINAIYAIYEDADDNAVQALELAEKYGIQYLVRDRSLAGISEEDFDLLPARLEKFKDHPALLGHLAIDEPGPARFPYLAKLKKAYHEVLPNSLFYVNLFPTYSSLAQRNGKDYKTYIQEYIDIVKPDVLSFDHYPLKELSGETQVTEDYLYNLEIISKAAKKADIPFWCFLQTMAYGLTNRSPDYEDIRWQAYTALAFGARGIQHFCYWTPHSGTEYFGEAMIDTNGSKTPIYDYASRLNHELLKFDHIFLSYKSVGQMVWSTEDAPVYTYMEDPLEVFSPVKTVEGGPVLMGCFEDAKGNHAIMLVNMTDPGREEQTEITVKFSDARALNVYTGGEKERMVLKNGKIDLVLKSGEGKFIQILS